MAKVRDHIARLNEHFGAHATPVFQHFALDEDTVTFRVRAGAATGDVSITLLERSSYPQTGGFAFSEGSDELVSAVEAIAPKLSDDASLDRCLRALATTVPATDGLDAQLVDVPGCQAAGAAGSSSAHAGASSATVDANDDSNDDDDDDGEAEEEEEDDDDLQANLDYDFAKGAELENSLLRLRHQWELKDQKRREESELAKEAEDKAAAVLSAQAGAKRKRPGPEGAKKGLHKQGAHQIFSSAEATRMLCNELFDLMKEEREGFDGVSADCIDHNIHQWRVQVSDIAPGSNLKADLEKVQELYGYSDLQLELSFIPDMHPFYPVFVKVLRPRFVGVVAEAVMTHPAMTLQGWDPMKRVKWLVRLVQAYLEQHGRVDLEDTRNDPKLHPTGAYSAAEFAICRLELLSSVAPVWASSEPTLLASRSADVDLDRIRELNYGKKLKPESTGPWASGVGYGHSGTEGGHLWDIAATEKAQAQADVEMRQMLKLVTECVALGELQPITLEISCLRPLLWRQLHTASLLDVGTRPERTSMYIQMLEMLRALAAWPNLQTVLSRPTSAGSSGGGSVITALASVRKQAEFLLRTTGRSVAKEDSELESTVTLAETIIKTASEVAQSAPPPVVALASPSVAAGGASSATARSEPGATSKAQSATPRTTRQAAAAAIAAAAAAPAATTKASSKTLAKAPAEAAASSEPTTDAAYEVTMKEISFDACEGIGDHYYETRPEGREAAATQLAVRSRRLATEAADMMGGSLPVSGSSSIWVRVNENAMQQWRAMISGPEGTPYSAGCFIFDILCPSEYPNVAPKVNLLTTGGGSVRFNPNLYNCGKVCLSLLGTWHGDQGESWHAKTSTLLQVLISIQALILVPDPFFNEPGYERNRGTPEGDRQNRAYNETIREGTVRHAMIDILAKPSDAFADPIRTHFRLRKTQILEQVRGWAHDKANSARHAEVMKSLLTQLEETIAKHAV